MQNRVPKLVSQTKSCELASFTEPGTDCTGTRRASTGRPVQLPASAALVTMADIREAAAQRRQRRQNGKEDAETGRKRFLRRAFSSPVREAEEQEKKRRKLTEEARKAMLVEMAGKLRSRDWKQAGGETRDPKMKC